MIADNRPRRNVYIAYAVGPMTSAARALMTALERQGFNTWSAHSDVPHGQTWEDAAETAIDAADAFAILVAAGDEQSRWLLFETRHILTRCWTGGGAEVAVLAPAVGAIPSSLRHQDFVLYFAHDDVRLERWATERSLAEAFVERWLRSPSRIREAAPKASQEEIRRWRNSVVHVGRGLGLTPEEMVLRLRQLRAELEGGDWVASDTAPSNRPEAALERAVLAQHLGDADLAKAYFELASRAASRAPLTGDASADYAAGLAALGAGELGEAAERLSTAAAEYEASHGELDPRTVAALYHLALALSAAGDRGGAETTYRAAFERSRASLGSHHPQTAAAAFNLAQLLAESGAREEALKCFKLAEQAYERVTPPGSAELAGVRSELARLYK